MPHIRYQTVTHAQASTTSETAATVSAVSSRSLLARRLIRMIRAAEPE